MEVNIDEINSTVRTVDGSSLLSPAVLRKIVETVTKTMQDKQSHSKRVDTERKLTQGVWAESGQEQP
jgi:hypothetical protein